MSTLMDLQRRNLAQMEESDAPAEPSGLTEARTPVSTELSEEVSTPARKRARAETRKPVRKETLSKADTSGFLAGVDVALASREPLIGGVKTTVDMSLDLSTRAKRYLADHRGQNTRQVLIALFDAFLTAKGY